MARPLKYEGFKLNQPTTENEDGSKNVLLASVPISDLVDETAFKINWWESGKKGRNDQGYQRRPNDNRVRKISIYLANSLNPVFPTNIVVTSAKPIKYEDGKIKIEPGNFPLWILDGQTRIEGFKYALEEYKDNERQIKKISSYEMPVVFLSNFKKIDEIEQFITLNSTQKKIQTDLAQSLKYELAKTMDNEEFNALYGDKWEVRALKVVDMLNHDSDQDTVWGGRIVQPNAKKTLYEMVSQNSFVTSLRPLYKGGVFEDQGPDFAFNAIKNYWNAVRRFFPDTFALRNDYVIQKTPGVFSLNDLANSVFRFLLFQKKDLTEMNIFGALEKAFGDKRDDFWMRDNPSGASMAGSMKGFKRLADEFKENLNS